MPKEKSSERSGKSFWSSKRIIIVFLVFLGLIVGMLIQHYYVEPVIGERCLGDLSICKSQNQVLDEENNACYQKNYDLNRPLADCQRDLRFFEQS